MKAVTRVIVLMLAVLLNDTLCTADETNQAGKTYIGTVLVVLGNEPLDDHTPTVDMIARVKKAVEFYRANPDSLLVLTGGATAGGVSEGPYDGRHRICFWCLDQRYAFGRERQMNLGERQAYRQNRGHIYSPSYPHRE